MQLQGFRSWSIFILFLTLIGTKYFIRLCLGCRNIFMFYKDQPDSKTWQCKVTKRKSVISSYDYECLHYSSKNFSKTACLLNIVSCCLSNALLYCSKIKPILSDLNVNMKRSPKSYHHLLLLLLNRQVLLHCQSLMLKI